jgi:hypothetical protein
MSFLFFDASALVMREPAVRREANVVHQQKFRAAGGKMKIENWVAKSARLLENNPWATRS